MNRSAKIAAIFICILLCTLGAIFSPNEKTDVRESKHFIVPIRNQEPNRHAWLLT